MLKVIVRLWIRGFRAFRKRYKGCSNERCYSWGLSAVLNEWAKQSGNDLLIFEEKIIVQDEVLGLCELFGYEAYELANEGTFILCVEKEDELKALEILKNTM